MTNSSQLDFSALYSEDLYDNEQVYIVMSDLLHSFLREIGLNKSYSTCYFFVLYEDQVCNTNK